jgi:hypothetical protein
MTVLYLFLHRKASVICSSCKKLWSYVEIYHHAKAESKETGQNDCRFGFGLLSGFSE